MRDILERIVEARVIDIAADRRERPPSSLRRIAAEPLKAFQPAQPGPSSTPIVIAECKRASPSRGVFRENYDPVALAAAYERGGALMLSVITEPRFFLGSAAHLEAVREAVRLPILRKDFIVDPYQIREAWAIGADAILLIAAILDEGALRELASCARELSLSVLVEIHDEGEIGKAIACSPDAIGVNMRNLRDFSVDGADLRDARARALRDRLPGDIPAVAESGLKIPADAVSLFRQGFGAFLVGEAFVTAANPEREVRSFVDALRLHGPVRGEEA